MANPPMFDLGAITGIKETRVANDDEDSLHLAIQAAKDCLKRSKYKPGDLDVVISCSISRYVDGPAHNNLFEPPLSLFIKNELGAPQAMHFDVSNACAGMFTGILLLDRMIKAGVAKTGLVVSGEHITHISRTAVKEIRTATDPQFGSMTVGDSAAAVIMDQAVDENEGIDYLELMTCSEYSRLCIGMPSNENAGPALYTINAEMHKKDRIQLWPNYQMDYYKSKQADIKTEKFDYIVHHQVGLKAVSNFNRYGSEYFQFQLPDPLNILEETGNTSTTSHFLVLHKALKDGTLKKGMKVLLVPAASGVVTGFLSLKISNLGV
ncbi:MAG: 3-oxoacyl-ACP synthase [Proteobacteria bacterium]|nr:MAG: 3-oxoacyl-ACP synthase [Pseudomonadota bacterium]